jgi:hypothetical protein
VGVQQSHHAALPTGREFHLFQSWGQRSGIET